VFFKVSIKRWSYFSPGDRECVPLQFNPGADILSDRVPALAAHYPAVVYGMIMRYALFITPEYASLADLEVLKELLPAASTAQREHQPII
jgi:hypothetical protein